MFFRPTLLTTLAAIGLPLGFGGLSACAGSYSNNLNSDPSAEISIRLPSVWRATGSHDGSGYISITDDIGSQQGTIVLPDIDPGLNVIAFTFRAKVRIGGGSARPADGMSITFADATDGIVTGGTVGEEGPPTGLSVNLDTWDNGNGDGPAVDIKMNNVIVAHKLFAGFGSGTVSRGPYCSVIERDAMGVPISLETEPAATPDPGTFVDLVITLDKCGTLTLNYKGIEIFKDEVTGYTPRQGRFVIGGRTGGAWDNHWIDDIQVTTDTGDAVARVASTLPSAPGRREISEVTPIQFVIDYSAVFAAPNPTTIKLTLNGTDVTSSATVVDDTMARTVTVTFTPTGNGFPPGSKQEAVLTYDDLSDPTPNSCTARNTFWVTPVPAMTDLGASLFIEAEDFNWSDGTTHGQFFDFGAPNGSYDMKAAQHDVDYHEAASNPDSPLYRVLVPPNGISVPGVADNLRAGTAITPDYKLGWNDSGDWYNYTRTLPNNTYTIWGRFSSGGADTASQLATVTSDPTMGGQTIQPIGEFRDTTTGGWDTFCFIPLRDASGNVVTTRLNGLTTLRVTVLPGNYDHNYIAFVPTFSEPLRPNVVSTTPTGESLRDPLIKAIIADRDTAVVANSIKLFLDGVELTPITITDTAGGAEASFQITSFLVFGSMHTAQIVFTDNHATSPVTQTNSWNFTVGPLKGGNKTLFIEGEDFNYSEDGTTGGLHANFGDPDCSLLGKNGVRMVDYFQTSGNDGGAVPAYRPMTDVECAKPGTDGLIRGDHTITCTYIVGWNDPDEWQNYTRDFGTTSTRYNVYARLSSGGNPESAELALITSDPTMPNQTKNVLGQFNSPATGNWDVFHFVPLRDGAGNLASVRLAGTNTFRFTVLPGNLDMNYLAFVEADDAFVEASILSVEPRADSSYARMPKIIAVFKDEDSAVVSSSLKLEYDGTDVTASSTIVDTAGGAEISFQVPGSSPVGTMHTVKTMWTDDQATPVTQTFTWKYTEGIYNAEKNLFIEMEDLNTASGTFIPSSMGHPFNEKAQYLGLDATFGVDYNDTTGDSHQYRAVTVNIGMVNLGDAFRTGAGPRPGFETVSDYKVGWTDPGPPDWFNYTRDYGAGGNFQIYLRASHGDGAATIGGRLDMIDDPASGTPVITPIGNFRAPATGNWDGFIFIPLKRADGSVANVALSGVQTLRYSVEANGGDVNYLMLCPVGPQLTIGPDPATPGNVLISWNGVGRLESAPSLTGPWTTVTGATSPHSTSAATGNRFFRTANP